MTSQIIYRYLGTNGIIESPVHLEGIYFVRLVSLSADKNKILTNGKVKKVSVLVPEDEVSNWKEIDD